jgi:hypothetical protein
VKPPSRRAGWTPRGDGMWDITLSDLKKAWALEAADLVSDGTESKVVLAVANSFLHDAPHILCKGSIRVPSPVGDIDRATRCLVWLACTAIPVWVSWWVKRVNTYKDEEVKSLVRELESVVPWAGDNAGQLEELALLLRSLLFMLPTESKIHRRSMHRAQQMGVRSVYRGALCHPTEVLHSMALMAANIFIVVCPNQEAHENILLLTETTQASALLLLDELTLEKEDGGTTNT